MPVRRIEDPRHPRGYRELRTPAAMRVLLNQKILDQEGCCALCGNPFEDYNDVFPDHRRPRGMGGAWRDDHPDNICAAHRLCNFEKGSKHEKAQAQASIPPAEPAALPKEAPMACGKTENLSAEAHPDSPLPSPGEGARPLTARERSLLNAIFSFARENRSSPTYGEIAARVGWRSVIASGRTSTVSTSAAFIA
jgi:hypothetical protein